MPTNLFRRFSRFTAGRRRWRRQHLYMVRVFKILSEEDGPLPKKREQRLSLLMEEIKRGLVMYDVTPIKKSPEESA